MASTNPLAILRANRRVWVIGAIHGDVNRLTVVHDQIAQQAKFGDRLVYCGNMIGHGSATHETIAEILRFRRWFLSIWPYTDQNDVVYLRGRQEEMLWKMTQVHFAQDPHEVIRYIYTSGLETVLNSYGFEQDRFMQAADEDTNALVSLTGRLTTAIRNMPGHDILYSQLKHAAYSEDGVILCVSSGLDDQKPLQKQGDNFWWEGDDFSSIIHAYGGFCRIIRGYDPTHSGLKETAFTLSIDGGCGYGGPLVGVCLDRQGEVLEMIKI